MVEQALLMMKTVYENCVAWTTSLFNATGGGNVVLAAFILVLIISMFIMPFRGGRVADGGAFADFVQGSIYKPRYSNGKRVKSDPNYKGKFEKRSHGGTRVSNRPR